MHELAHRAVSVRVGADVQKGGDELGLAAETRIHKRALAAGQPIGSRFFIRSTFHEAGNLRRLATLH